MNRRDLLRRAFAVGAAGLMLPVVEPVRRVWALDHTMIPNPYAGKVTTGGREHDDIDIVEFFRGEHNLTWVNPNQAYIASNWWSEEVISLTDDFFKGDYSPIPPMTGIAINGELMWVINQDGERATVLRGPHTPYAASSSSSLSM